MPARSVGPPRGGVVGLARDRVVGPVGRAGHPHLAGEEDGGGEQNAADPVRAREGLARRRPDVLPNSGDDVGRGGSAVGFAKGIPGLADGEPAEGGEEAEPDDGVAVGLLELEDEGLAERERLEVGPSRGLPEVGLIEPVRGGRQPGEVAVPVGVGVGNEGAHWGQRYVLRSSRSSWGDV